MGFYRQDAKSAKNALREDAEARRDAGTWGKIEPPRREGRQECLTRRGQGAKRDAGAQVRLNGVVYEAFGAGQRGAVVPWFTRYTPSRITTTIRSCMGSMASPSSTPQPMATMGMM